MNIGDKVYCIDNELIGEVVDTSPVIGGNLYNVMLENKKLGKFYLHLIEKDFLSMEQCADMFANKELEQLVLNYKK